MRNLWDNIFLLMALVVFLAIVFACSGFMWSKPAFVAGGFYVIGIISIVSIVMASIFRQRSVEIKKEYNKEKMFNRVYIDQIFEENQACYETIDELMKEKEFLLSVLKNCNTKGMN